MDLSALTQIEIQVAAPLALGMGMIGLAWTSKRLGLTADSVANTAIQNAVNNFAGQVAGGLASGTITKATAVAQLGSYLQNTVSESLAQVAPTPEALTTMLLGKAAQVAGVDPAAISAIALHGAAIPVLTKAETMAADTTPSGFSKAASDATR